MFILCELRSIKLTYQFIFCAFSWQKKRVKDLTSFLSAREWKWITICFCLLFTVSKLYQMTDKFGFLCVRKKLSCLKVLLWISSQMDLSSCLRKFMFYCCWKKDQCPIDVHQWPKRQMWNAKIKTSCWKTWTFLERKWEGSFAHTPEYFMMSFDFLSFSNSLWRVRDDIILAFAQVWYLKITIVYFEKLWLRCGDNFPYPQPSPKLHGGCNIDASTFC